MEFNQDDKKFIEGLMHFAHNSEGKGYENFKMTEEENKERSMQRINQHIPKKHGATADSINYHENINYLPSCSSTGATGNINAQSPVMGCSSSTNVFENSCPPQTSQINAIHDFIEKYDILKETAQSSDIIKYTMDGKEQKILIQDSIKQEILHNTSSTNRPDQFERYHLQRELEYKIKSQQIMSQLIGKTASISDQKEKRKKRNIKKPSNKTKKSNTTDNKQIMSNTKKNPYVHGGQDNLELPFNQGFQQRNINYQTKENINIPNSTLTEETRRGLNFVDTSYKSDYMNTGRMAVSQPTIITQNEPIMKPSQCYESGIKPNNGAINQLHEFGINTNKGAANQLYQSGNQRNNFTANQLYGSVINTSDFANNQLYQTGINTNDYVTNQPYGLGINTNAYANNQFNEVNLNTNNCAPNQFTGSVINTSGFANNQLYQTGINTNDYVTNQPYGLGINTNAYANNQFNEVNLNTNNCAPNQLNGSVTNISGFANNQLYQTGINTNDYVTNQPYGLGINTNAYTNNQFNEVNLNTNNCAPNQLNGSVTNISGFANNQLYQTGINTNDYVTNQPYGLGINTNAYTNNQFNEVNLNTNNCAPNQLNGSVTNTSGFANNQLYQTGINTNDYVTNQPYGLGINTNAYANNQFNEVNLNTNNCAPNQLYEINKNNDTANQFYAFGINTNDYATNQLYEFGTNKNSGATRNLHESGIITNNQLYESGINTNDNTRYQFYECANNGAIYNQSTNMGNITNCTIISEQSKEKRINKISTIRNQEMGIPLTGSGSLKRTREQIEIIEDIETANTKIIRYEDNKLFTKIHTTEKLQLSCSQTTVHKYEQQSALKKIDADYNLGSNYSNLSGIDNQGNLTYKKIRTQPNDLSNWSARNEMNTITSPLGEKHASLNITNTTQPTNEPLGLMNIRNPAATVHQQTLFQNQSFQSNRGNDTTVTNHSSHNFLSENQSLNIPPQSSITHSLVNSSASSVEYKILKGQKPYSDVICYQVGDTFHYKLIWDIIKRDVENKTNQPITDGFVEKRRAQNFEDLKSYDQQPSQCSAGTINEPNIIYSNEQINNYMEMTANNDSHINYPQNNRNTEGAFCNQNNFAGGFPGMNEINQEGSNYVMEPCYMPQPEIYQHNASLNIPSNETNFNIQCNNLNPNLNESFIYNHPNNCQFCQNNMNQFLPDQSSYMDNI